MRGVALPMALFCLVALAALLSGLLLVASTELTVSLAHRDSVEDRYATEGAVHAWIAERGEELRPEVVDSWLPPGSAAPARIVVERLAASSGSDENALYSVHAAPLRGGTGARSAVAFARTRPLVPDSLSPAITATVTAGGGVRIQNAGGAGPTVLDGVIPDCTDPDPAPYAVVIGAGRPLVVSGLDVLQGVDFVHQESDLALARVALGGQRIRDLAWNADHHFGRYFNAPALPAGAEIRSGHPNTRLDWGCPAQLLAGLPAGAEASCGAGASSGVWRMVAIDAANDTVTLASHHGQGILIVVNGHLHIGESFVYRGLILVEGSLVISGGGIGWPPSIEGAMVAGGEVLLFDGRDPATGAATGYRRSIRFDRCAVKLAVAAFNDAGPDRWQSRRVQGRPHGWFTVLE